MLVNRPSHLGNKQNNAEEMIRVRAKEYFGMRDCLGKMQEKLDDVMKATQNALGIIDEMHKETKHNEK